MATATRRDELARWRDTQAIVDALYEKTLDEVASRAEAFEPWSLEVTPTEFQILNEGLGGRGIHEICTALALRSAVLARRAKCSSAQLAAAEKRLADAVAAEQETTAEIADLAEADGTTTPRLLQQVSKLEAKLRPLTAARVAAETEVTRILADIKWIALHVPAPLRRQADAELLSLRRTAPTWRELEARRLELHSLKGVLYTFERGGDARSIIEPLITIYCRQHLPDYFRDKANRVVDGQRFAEHVASLRGVRLPDLIAEIGRLESEWNEIVAQVEAPIYRWVETGELEF